MAFSIVNIVLCKHIVSVLSTETKSRRSLFVNSIVYGSNTSDINEEDSLRIGDVIVSINNVSVDCLKLDYINETLSNVMFPVTLVIHRFNCDVELVNLLRDARTSAWIQQYCKLPLSALQSSSNVETLIYLWSMLDYVRGLVSFLSCIPTPVDEVGFLILSFRECVGYFDQAFLESVGTELPAELKESLDCTVRANLEDLTSVALCGQISGVLETLSRWLTNQLQEQFYEPFRASATAARMCGWLSESPSYEHVELIDLLRSSALWSYLYLFVLTKCRHQTRLTSVVEEISTLMQKCYCSRDSDDVNTSSVTAALPVQLLEAGWKLLREGGMTAFYKSDMYEILLADLNHAMSDGLSSSSCRKGFTLRSGSLHRLFRSTDLPSHLTKSYLSHDSAAVDYRRGDEVCAFQFSTSITPDYDRGAAAARDRDIVFVSPLSTSSSYDDGDRGGERGADLPAVDCTTAGTTAAGAAPSVVVSPLMVKYEVVYRSAEGSLERSCFDAQLVVDQQAADSDVTAPSDTVEGGGVSNASGGHLSCLSSVLLPFCVPREDYINTNTTSAASEEPPPPVLLHTFVVTVRSGQRLYGCSLLRRSAVATLDWSLAINYAGVHRIASISKIAANTGVEGSSDVNLDNNGGKQHNSVRLMRAGLASHSSDPVTAAGGVSASAASSSAAALSTLGSRLYSGWQTALAVGSSLPIVPIFKDDLPPAPAAAAPNSAASQAIQRRTARKESSSRKEPKPIRHTRHHSYSSGMSALRLSSSAHHPPVLPSAAGPTSRKNERKEPLTSGVEFDRSLVMCAGGVCVFTNRPHCLEQLKVLLSSAYADCTMDDLEVEELNRRILSAVNSKLHRDPLHSSLVDDSHTYFSVVFECLSPVSISTLLLCCLLEYKIVLRSSLSLNAAVAVGEFLLHCLHPLRYCHLYAPLLPLSVAVDLLQCPTPYIIGIDVSTVVFPSDVVLVDIDRDSVTVPAPLQPGIKDSGRSLETALSRCLRPLLHRLDSVNSDTASSSGSVCIDAAEPVRLCRQFVSDLLQGVPDCISAFGDAAGEGVIVFDEMKYVQLKCDSTSGCDVEPALLALLLRSQCFSEYIIEISRRAK